MTDLDTFDPRAGASLAPLEEPVSDLPLVVWLRGDEPFAGDFSLDADQVMAQLGIRRSRLTQISGKELRVGRMRKGRYVSPVYRPVDVDAYTAWTRPPATHQKAAEVIDEVVSRLDDRQEALQSGFELLVATLTDKLGNAPRQLMDALLPLIRAQRQEMAAFSQEARLGLTTQATRVAALESAIDRMDTQAAKREERLLATLAAVMKLAQESAGASRVVADELKAVQLGILALQDDLAREAPRPIPAKAPSRARARALSRESKVAPQASAGDKRRAFRRAYSGSPRPPRKRNP